MQTISKQNLNANMFEIFRELELNHEELIVTDYGIPILKIVPLRPKKTVDELFGPYRGQMTYSEDLDTPTVDEWVGLV